MINFGKTKSNIYNGVRKMTNYDWGMLVGLVSLFILGIVIPYIASGG